jgi:hypothetical protein
LSTVATLKCSFWQFEIAFQSRLIMIKFTKVLLLFNSQPFDNLFYLICYVSVKFVPSPQLRNIDCKFWGRLGYLEPRNGKSCSKIFYVFKWGTLNSRQWRVLEG